MMDNIFKLRIFDAFDSDVDEASTAQTMFMANLSSTDPVMMKPVRLMIRTFYLSAVLVVQSNVSSIPNDAYMMMLNDIYEPSAKCVSITTQNNIIDNSLTAELATYKEQVELYERRAKFELTEREQKINEQLRIVITVTVILRGRNFEKGTSFSIVHNSEDTLEIAEITRKKMNDKMNDLEYVKKKVKIAPPDYSKENYLATFTPQKQLTPEQIFWSNDLIKMKAEALKKQTTAS
ncbi:hypothetical protein Tco_0243196 [Tanacetum coccineum]